MNALLKYNTRADAVNSLVCVGLDTEVSQIPAEFQGSDTPQFSFNRWIIEQTHPYVAAYKLNTAFYEYRAEVGWRELRQTIDYLREHHPDILTICDAKRGDISSTNSAYAGAIFDELGFDAVTLHPYVGREGLQPFLDRADRACIILCRTSNPGASELQTLLVGDKALWQVVAEKVAGEWNQNGNCMLVMGATYPAEIEQARRIVGDMTLLVPGVGAQGGDVEAVVRGGINATGKGLIINASRGILRSPQPDEAARLLRESINACRF
ncbi:MAG: orotidine-5'-phosphate decarboxylase [Anaerolineae bacterium]|nr:orotidine-5'-phosphate decarboxylase [Anaerolineae bacterium]